MKYIFQEIVLVGLVSGFFGGLVTLYFGLSLQPEAFQILLLLMIGMAFINHRYICPAYAGGMLAIYSSLSGYEKVNVPSLLAMVAFIHFIEGFLIYKNREKDHSAVFIMKDGKITGAFIKQSYWAIPVMALVPIALMQVPAISNNILIQWSPLFNKSILLGTCALTGIIAVSGYSSISISSLPASKSKKDAVQIIVYGFILFALAYFSQYIWFLGLIGGLFSLAAHEGMYIYSLFIEKKNNALFVSADRGIKILDIYSGSHAEKMRLQRGDIILSINGKSIYTEEGMKYVLSGSPTFVWIYAIGLDGRYKLYEYKCYPEGVSDLGILIVPREREVTYNIDYYHQFTMLKNIVGRIRFKR